MALPVFLFLCVELAFVAVGDLRTRKIPNAWSLLNLAVFPVLYVLLPEAYALGWQTVSYSLAILLIGFVLFLAQVMGAGDVKFMCTFFLLVPNQYKESLFSALLVCTMILGGAFFLTNLVRKFPTVFEAIKRRDVQAVKNCFGTKFSYAPVILMAWLWIGWTLRENFVY